MIRLYGPTAEREFCWKLSDCLTYTYTQLRFFGRKVHLCSRQKCRFSILSFFKVFWILASGIHQDRVATFKPNFLRAQPDAFLGHLHLRLGTPRIKANFNGSAIWKKAPLLLEQSWQQHLYFVTACHFIYTHLCFLAIKISHCDSALIDRITLFNSFYFSVPIVFKI